MPETPIETSTPAQRLRRMAAAVRVHFTWWGVHKTLSAEQKEEFGSVCSADTKLITAGKRIIDVKHERYRKLTKLRSRIASFWRSMTLPYVEPGVRLIRQDDIEVFVHKMNGFRDDLAEAANDLERVYEEIKADARRRLGNLFDPADYPPNLSDLFGVEFDFPSVEPPNYLMRLNPELYQQEQQRITRRFEEAVQLAEQAFIGEFAKLVSHLTERLSSGSDGERKIFRDSAISNLINFFEHFRQLNVHSNEQLDTLVEQAQQVVRGVQPQELRDDQPLRQHVATQLSSVQSVLDGMMVDRPRRRIIRRRETE